MNEEKYYARVDNSDVPLEAVVKWLAKEKDMYKRKLEILVPYTKSLELRLKAYEADAGSYSKATGDMRQNYESQIASIRKKIRGQIGQLEAVVKNLGGI